jgi:hypothetical protein
MTTIRREKYAYSSRREQSTCFNATNIKSQDLEYRVFEGLQSILLGREETMTAFVMRFPRKLSVSRQAQRQIRQSYKNTCSR